MNNIFITGGTGFLGAEIIKELLLSSNDKIFALVRGDCQKEAEQRMFRMLKKAFSFYKLDSELKSRVKILVGDITKKDFGLSKAEISSLSEKIDVIFNNAAVTELVLPLKEIRKINVEGTKKVLDFALLCNQNGKIKKIYHTSTAYIVGTRVCSFKEEDLDVGQNFNNTYEQSKFEAEKLIYSYREKGLNIDIFRPGIILGRHSDGMTTNFKMFYQPLRFFSMEFVTRIPSFEGSKPNLINVDIVAKAIVLISGSSKADNMNFHIVSSNYPTLLEILESASCFFGFKLPKFVDKKEIDIYTEYSPANRIMIEPFIPYLNYKTTFKMDNTLREVDGKDFTFPDFNKENLLRLYEYCHKTGFIKRKKNVVVK